MSLADPKADSDGRPKPRVWLWRFALASTLLAVGAYFLETFIAEDSWFSMLVLHFPQWPFAAFPFLAAIWAIRRRDRMAIWFSIAGIAIGVHLCAPCWKGFGQSNSRADEAQTIKVLTFNLQECHGGAARIANMLSVEGPDIAAFEEAKFLSEESPRAKAISYALPGYHWYRHANLAIASRWQMDRTWVADFKTTTHSWAIFAVVRWEDSPQRSIVVGANHFNPVQWDRFFSPEIGKLPDHLRSAGRIRETQAEELLREIGKADPSAAVILCGDFNGPPRGRVYDRLMWGLKDSFAESASGFGWTIPAGFPMMRIDYVFVGQRSYPARCRVLDNAGSDHRPMVAEIVP